MRADQFTPDSFPRRFFAALILALPLVAMLSGCGFQLRGQSNLPFDTLYVAGASPMLVELKRNVAAGSNTKVVDQAAGAEAVLALSLEAREKVILSLDTAGRVREYQLRYRVGFVVHDGKGNNWIPTSEIALTRDISFNDAQIIAKEAEEALLYRDMQSDMVQQIVRRLTRAKRSGA
ncbi:MAG: LPS assembly lipoprotein LptE [Burkholderiales bacterium]